jgi:hypothetical protein
MSFTKIGSESYTLDRGANEFVTAFSILLYRFRRSPVQQKYTYAAQLLPVWVCENWCGGIHILHRNTKRNLSHGLQEQLGQNLWNSFNKVISQGESNSCYYFVFDAQNVESNEATEIREFLRKVGRLIRCERADWFQWKWQFCAIRA